MGRLAHDRFAYRQGHPDAPERFLTAAEAAFELLRQHPRIGRLRSFSVPGVRSWVIPDFQNYLVFYLPTSAEVQILEGVGLTPPLTPPWIMQGAGRGWFPEQIVVGKWRAGLLRARGGRRKAHGDYVTGQLGRTLAGSGLG